MYVVIFRAKAKNLNAEYLKTANQMRELAINQYNCIEFQALTEGENEIALSYWNSEEDIRAWRSNLEHVQAQKLGKEVWYESYTVQIAEITREYKSK